MNELALFAGAGGGLLASNLLGWTTVAAVEIEKYPREVLLQRQRDGVLDSFPIWDDVRTFDGIPWRGLVDVVSGGFPCQDISVAGKGIGLSGERSSLWFEYLRIIGEVQPSFVFAENSPALRSRGLGVVIQGLSTLGYDTRWGVLGAWHIGANHRRDRIWVFASNTNDSVERTDRWSGQSCTASKERDDTRRVCENVPNTKDSGRKKQRIEVATGTAYETADRCRWWETEPPLGRVVDGLANRVDQIRAIGNGQVPGVAATAYQTLAGVGS